MFFPIWNFHICFYLSGCIYIYKVRLFLVRFIFFIWLREFILNLWPDSKHNQSQIQSVCSHFPIKGSLPQIRISIKAAREMVDWVRWTKRLYEFKRKKGSKQLHSFVVAKGKKIRTLVNELKTDACDSRDANVAKHDFTPMKSNWSVVDALLPGYGHHCTRQHTNPSHIQSRTQARNTRTHTYSSREMCRSHAQAQAHTAKQGGIEHCALYHRSKFLGGRYGIVCAPVYVLHVEPTERWVFE